jgi:hypothetical protein
MSINQFEFIKPAATFRAFRLFDLPHGVIERIRAVKFDLAESEPGFHDIDRIGGTVAGSFSRPEAFEVEHCTGGTTTKAQLMRLKTCAFWLFEDLLIFTGDGAAIKMAHGELTSIFGFCPSPILFDTAALLNFAGRLHLSAVAGKNSKENPVRTIKVAGKIEEAEIATGIEMVKGLWDGWWGPVTVTAKKDGALTVKAKAGFSCDISGVARLFQLILGERQKEETKLDAGDLFDQTAGQTSVEIEIDGVRAKFASPEEMAAKLKAAVRKAGGPA